MLDATRGPLDIQPRQSASLSSDPGFRASQIHDEQIRIHYGYLPALIVTGILVAAGTVFALWDAVSHTALLAWLAAIAGVAVLRGIAYWRYQRTRTDRLQRRWATYVILGSGAAGVLWGTAGVALYPPESLEHQLFLLFVLAWMGAGALSTLSAYLPVFYSYFPISLLPMSVLLLQGDRVHVTLGVLAIIYVASLSFFARGIGRSLVETLKLRFENIDLVAELSRQKEEAERANVAKSKFLAAASHDLRQPLHTLTLFTSALDDRITNPDVRKIVGNINDSVRALEKLFNALLDMSRLDAGVLQPAIRHFRLQDLHRNLVNDYAPEAEGKGLQFMCPPCEHVVRSDPVLLERILRNFVSNAIRYTERGEVRVTCVPQGDQVCIAVSDTGIGIPADHHREIFNEFYQLGNPERDRAKGLGLGLAIVDRVARLLGYPVMVQSTPGEGSCFSVDVPLGDLRQVVVEETAPTDSALNDLAGLRVMVVDDEISIREGMRVLLHQWGCAVTLAGSEDEAVTAARESGSAPEAIIADYRLREERTGVEAIKHLRHEFGANIPALIISGDTAVERLREVNTGGYQLVHKPAQPAMLRAFLRNARGQKHML